MGTNEIAESQVETEITINEEIYITGDDVTLGASLKIDFTSIGELESGYFIDSCVASNELDNILADGTVNVLYKSLNLVNNGCAETVDSINPKLGVTSSDLAFEQFAFVDASSTFETPVLKFELNCVLKFGTAPTCDQAAEGRRRRNVGEMGQKEPVNIKIPVSVEGPINYAGGIATAGKAKSAESGATEMLVSAIAAAGILLL